MDEEVDKVCVCAFCRGPWHQATGFLVGTPQMFPFCGRCWREAMRCFSWATNRKGRKGTVGFTLEFYPTMVERKATE